MRRDGLLRGREMELAIGRRCFAWVEVERIMTDTSWTELQRQRAELNTPGLRRRVYSFLPAVLILAVVIGGTILMAWRP